MEMQFPENIQNIVFDLGGVLYAIDPRMTTSALSLLAGPNAEKLAMDSPLFLELEIGSITAQDFRDRLRSAIDSKASDEELDAAWNALLCGPISGRLAWIKALSEKFRVILLSNTNVIHQSIWGPECAEMFSYMERTWFSFELGMRKPDTSIYEHVLKVMEMKPEETIFLDDSISNIEGAKAAGLHTLWIDPKDSDQFKIFCLEIAHKC